MTPMNRHLDRRCMGRSAVLLGLVAGLAFVPAAQSAPDTQASSLSTAPNSVIETIGLRDHVADRITQGFPANEIRPLCLNMVHVTARISGKDIATGQRSDAGHGWSTISGDLMTTLFVDIYDTPLEYSASTVSRNLILHNDAAKKQKESDAAKQRPVSDL